MIFAALRSACCAVLGAILIALALTACERAPVGPANVAAVQNLGQDDGLRATFKVEPTSLTTAQRIEVRLEVRLKPGLDLQDVDMAAALPEGFEIVKQDADRRSGEGGVIIVERRWTIDPFLAGEHEIGALKVSAVGAGAPAALETQAVKVGVASVLQPGEEELAEAKPVVEPPFEMPPWSWWAMGGAAAALGALAWMVARRRRRLLAGPEPVFVPAHTVALERLRALLARRLVEAGRFDDFYTEASLILRRYIEDRFGLHAPERTTEEFLIECRASPQLMQDDVALLRKFLGHCDMVKFAAVIPSTPEAEGVADTVRQFIERTQDVSRTVQVQETRA